MQQHIFHYQVYFVRLSFMGALKLKKKKPSKNQEEDTLTFRKSKGYE